MIQIFIIQLVMMSKLIIKLVISHISISRLVLTGDVTNTAIRILINNVILIAMSLKVYFLIPKIAIEFIEGTSLPTATITSTTTTFPQQTPPPLPTPILSPQLPYFHWHPSTL